MKRSFLRELGLEQEVIDKIMEEYGKNIEALDNKVQTLTAERDEAVNLAKKFEGVDLEELKSKPEEIKNKYEAKFRNMAVKRAKIDALNKAKAKYPELLVSLFDDEKITIDENEQVQGVEEQLKAIQENYADQFGAELGGKQPENPDSSNEQAFNFGWIPNDK